MAALPATNVNAPNPTSLFPNNSHEQVLVERLAGLPRLHLLQQLRPGLHPLRRLSPRAAARRRLQPEEVQQSLQEPAAEQEELRPAARLEQPVLRRKGEEQVREREQVLLQSEQQRAVR